MYTLTDNSKLIVLQLSVCGYIIISHLSALVVSAEEVWKFSTKYLLLLDYGDEDVIR